jgi:hypothetical protein
MGNESQYYEFGYIKIQLNLEVKLINLKLNHTIALAAA